MKKHLFVGFGMFMCACTLFLAGNVKAAGGKTELLQELHTLAAEGKMLNSPFCLGDAQAAVVERWGEPDYAQQNGPLTFYGYRGAGVQFGYTAGVVTQINASNDDIRGMVYSDVTTALGEPRFRLNDTLFGYQAGQHVFWVKMQSNAVDAHVLGVGVRVSRQ